ncbi:hypothetical protein LVD15_06620 [Fulvivirga maritima]|uniref:hypothetical protein n=1 Tax=Fulvivirga maritima TaxID=2904247 RepID=UPI001F2C66E9|nr:hypothetical protein [Fulvivirga maritima]UII28095.1 hypothetical protein LVD15_06620 [Fulvivirga maritima]
MQALTTPDKKRDSLNIFLVGNNPIELGHIYDKLKQIKHKTYHAEIGFNLKGLYKKIINSNPSCILIDDNFDRSYMKSLVKRLSSGMKTRHIPITIIKNSNYSEAYLADAQEYILKDGITSESLSRSILNAIKFKSMHAYLYKQYKKEKSRITQFFSK